MALKRTFFGLPAQTLQTQLNNWLACLTAISGTAQSYSIAGRSVSRAQLAEVKDTIRELQAALNNANGRRITRVRPDFSRGTYLPQQ
jgi:hypothetical protein